MKLFKAVIVSDKAQQTEVEVEASSLRVAFTKAARHCSMNQWASIKITFVRKVEFGWILVFNEIDSRNSAWWHWVPRPEHGTFSSAAVAMQHASTIMGIGDAELCKVKARRVRS